MTAGALALVMALAVACGGGDDGDAMTQTTTTTTTGQAAAATTTTTAATTQQAATTTQAQPTGPTSITVARPTGGGTQTTGTTTEGTMMMKKEPVYGGTINSFVFGGALTFDPHHFDFRGAAPGCSMQHQYDRLIDYQRPFDPAQGAVTIPGLAESWEPNAAGDVWTFNLREGVTFHDGSEFTADDVVATFQRVLETDWDVSTRVVIRARQFMTDVTKVDDHTVQFHLDAPNRTVIPFLGSPYAGHILNSDDITTNDRSVDTYPWKKMEESNGTGPWLLIDFDTDTGQKWERNPNYWGTDPEGNSYPYLDVYNHPVVRDDTTRFALIQSGGIDLWPGCGPTIKKAEADAMIQRVGADKLGAIDSSRGLFTHYFINWEIPPFDNPNVVEALRLAIPVYDMYNIPDQGRGLPGRTVQCDWFPEFCIPQDEFETFPSRNPDPAQRAADLSRAKQLMCDAFADCTAPFQYELGLGEPGMGFEMWTIAVQGMRDVGFTLEAQLKEYGVYMAEIREGRWHMTRENLFQSVNDPLDPYAISLLSVGTGLGGRPWYYPGQERMDEVFFRYARSIDNAAAQEEAKAIERILNEPQLPMISIGWPATNRMYYLYVKNWFPGPGSMTLEDLKHVWIDKGQ